MVGTSPRALKSDLAKLSAAGLVAVTDCGSQFEAYPVGSWVLPKPHNHDARASVLHQLGGHAPGAALVACLSDLAQTGVTDLQAAETIAARARSRGAKAKVDAPLSKGKERKGKDPLAGSQAPPPSAPETDTAPTEETDVKLKPRPHAKTQGKAIALLKLYMEICAPAGLRKIRVTKNGGMSKTMIDAARIAIANNGADFDWRDYFAYCAKSDFLCGRSNPAPGRKRFVATFAWIVGKQNKAKIESGNFHNEPQKAGRSTSVWDNNPNNFAE